MLVNEHTNVQVCTVASKQNIAHLQEGIVEQRNIVCAACASCLSWRTHTISSEFVFHVTIQISNFICTISGSVQNGYGTIALLDISGDDDGD